MHYCYLARDVCRQVSSKTASYTNWKPGFTEYKRCSSSHMCWSCLKLLNTEVEEKASLYCHKEQFIIMKCLLYFACCSQRIDLSPMVAHECNVKQLTEKQQRLGCWRGFFKEATGIEGWNGIFHNRRVGSLEHSLHGLFPIHSTPQTQTQTTKLCSLWVLPVSAPAGAGSWQQAAGRPAADHIYNSSIYIGQ